MAGFLSWGRRTSPMHYLKPALTFEQQADQLLQRGLIADRALLVGPTNTRRGTSRSQSQATGSSASPRSCATCSISSRRKAAGRLGSPHFLPSIRISLSFRWASLPTGRNPRSGGYRRLQPADQLRHATSSRRPPEGFPSPPGFSILSPRKPRYLMRTGLLRHLATASLLLAATAATTFADDAQPASITGPDPQSPGSSTRARRSSRRQPSPTVSSTAAAPATPSTRSTPPPAPSSGKPMPSSP